MTQIFHKESWRPAGSCTAFFKCWKKRIVNPDSYIWQKIPLKNKRQIKTFWGEGRLRKFVARSPIVKMNSKKSLNRKETIKEETEYQKRIKNKISKNMGKYNRFHFSFLSLVNCVCSLNKNHNNFLMWF